MRVKLILFIKNPQADQDPKGTSNSVEDIRLKAEFETHRDIRGYLQRWQDVNPKILDPIREPTVNPASGPPAQWIGTMLNGREAWEATWDNSNPANRNDLDPSDDFEGAHLEPGDMVCRLSADGLFNFAIYVRSIHRQLQFYTDRGNWRICSNRELDYVVKGFASPHLLEPIKPYFPDALAHANMEIQTAAEGGLPRPLGAPLLQMMSNFQEHVLEFYRNHSQVMDNLHNLVADDSEYLCLSLEDLTMRVLGIDKSELNSVNLFTIHMAVRKHPFIIEKDSRSLFSQMYLVQPKRIANTVKQVTDWVHEHQEFCIRAVMKKETPGFKDHPMQQFIQKAQRLIRLSRKIRSPTIMSSVGPSSQRYLPGQDGKPLVYREVLTENFTKNDQTILEYLQLYAIPAVMMASGTLRSTASHIMRATGMYNALGLSESSTRLFLQELGVIAPWENLGVLDQNLLLPGHGMSVLDDMKWEEIEESCASLPSDRLQDSMHHLRKDWGDLPVYCVDDATAQEIDDGVSLERVPGSDDTFWVHIHVANPTAFLTHDDPIMQYAGLRLATTYVPERTYPMLPDTLTQDHFSLAAGRPTLTFSAKMNLQGDILDTEVKNGTIRNVISFTHGTLRTFFNPNSKTNSDSLVVGGTFVDPVPTQGKALQKTLSSEDQETFSLLRQLMIAFRHKRQQNGAMDYPPSRRNASVSVQVGDAPLKPYEMQVTEGRYYLGDPIIRLGMQSFDPHEVRDQSKDYLVSLLMNLAGHVAGQFCAARNIPVVYDGTWYDPEYGRVTRHNMAEFGGQRFFEMGVPKTLSASTPVHHHVLGLDVYVKSTSPLRRFTDVIAHYQIEAALRFEHEHGRKFDAGADLPGQPALTVDRPNDPAPVVSAVLPFSKADLDAHITFSQPLRARLRDTSLFASQHWACMLLFRAFYFAECALPATFQCLLRTPRLVPTRDGTVYSGVISDLGVACAIYIPEDCPGRQQLDIFGVVEARITAVDMATLEVHMEATRLVKPFERTGEWA
ncbi:hypothetical protein NUU61_005759 [Penicillium alfredii]|uniref:RNB domain-containing protein n=1 Tax=Penicillium alfredii TaxID=1506179 RepID=A0A9W9K7Z7_9EURO|nr:uncharacterized protein NUU61_005759 [Penicillium alfredii]KAJ5096403.1 hypothetical protein NUU61_005759 [Penicillium alfredii]